MATGQEIYAGAGDGESRKPVARLGRAVGGRLEEVRLSAVRLRGQSGRNRSLSGREHMLHAGRSREAWGPVSHAGRRPVLCERGLDSHRPGQDQSVHGQDRADESGAVCCSGMFPGLGTGPLAWQPSGGVWGKGAPVWNDEETVKRRRHYGSADQRGSFRAASSSRPSNRALRSFSVSARANCFNSARRCSSHWG